MSTVPELSDLDEFLSRFMPWLKYNSEHAIAIADRNCFIDVINWVELDIDNG